MNDILINIRKMVINAINAQKLTDIVHGTVISTSPLKVKVDQKLVLNEEHLNLTRAVEDFTVEMTVSGTRNTYTVHNALKTNDKVTMIRSHGGQQYIIIDKE